jgi:nitric oxide reductase NorE protein
MTATELPDFLRTEGDRQPTRAGSGVRARSVPADVPGEVGIWIFLLGDMSIFGAFFAVFLWEGRQRPEQYADSAAALNQGIGAVNTVVLLLSSYLVVVALQAYRAGASQAMTRALWGATACAALFAGLKSTEYVLGLSSGHVPSSNVFFTFYYVLTGIHLLHVVIGLGLLTLWRRRTRRETVSGSSAVLVECAAAYWHMVDLLWIVIFTLLYLVVLP